MTPDAPVEMARRVRATAGRHVDGLAVGTTVAALDDCGLLTWLVTRESVRLAELAAEFGAHPGFLHVAVRLLADQGWVEFGGDPAPDRLSVSATPAGREMFTVHARAYARAAAFLPTARRLEGILAGTEPAAELAGFLTLLRTNWGQARAGRSVAVRHQVLAHLRGHVLGPLLVHLTRSGRFATGGFALTDPAARWAAAALAGQGWATIEDNTARPTAKGELATVYAGQYGYPLVYLPLLTRVPELIFGDPQVSAVGDAHLDRELDVRFSGDVFSAVCRRPFLQIALPLFDREPIARQPRMLVDTGCGDGTVLAALHTAIRSSTARGRALDTNPLLAVAVDPSPVARAIAAHRLEAAGIEHLVLDGDIADPVRLERDLAARGLDARDALHLCKSAIHDRAFEDPVGTTTEPPHSYAAYANPDGAVLPAADIARSLAQLLARWRPVTARHGWLVIEAHASTPATAVRLMGRTSATTLDATHGYSCQYPVEPQVFAWAAGEAGFESRAHAEPARAQLGYTALTIDHLVART